MNPTQTQIEVLKRGETIEIEKEWVECECNCHKDKFKHYKCGSCECDYKGKIAKYQEE